VGTGKRCAGLVVHWDVVQEVAKECRVVMD
jgi:hypothetical protein